MFLTEYYSKNTPSSGRLFFGNRTLTDYLVKPQALFSSPSLSSSSSLSYSLSSPSFPGYTSPLLLNCPQSISSLISKIWSISSPPHNLPRTQTYLSRLQIHIIYFSLIFLHHIGHLTCFPWVSSLSIAVTLAFLITFNTSILLYHLLAVWLLVLCFSFLYCKSDTIKKIRYINSIKGKTCTETIPGALFKN